MKHEGPLQKRKRKPRNDNSGRTRKKESSTTLDRNYSSTYATSTTS